MAFHQGSLTRQAAAVPFRIAEGGRIEILLIRRRNQPWGIPKGNVDPGHTLRNTALNEAAEEAGLHGELLEEALGEFVYRKGFGERLVSVYAMRVSEVEEHWLEQDFRERGWFGIEQALTAVGRKQLQPMISKLGRILLTK